MEHVTLIREPHIASARGEIPSLTKQSVLDVPPISYGWEVTGRVSSLPLQKPQASCKFKNDKPV